MRRHYWLSCLLVLGFMLLGTLPTVQAQEPVRIAPAFSRYYWRGVGRDMLGLLESPAIELDGRVVQYFEKARLEDHRDATTSGSWRVMYGRVVAELIEFSPTMPLNGTNLTYGDLIAFMPLEPPPDAASGPRPVAGGVFVPFTADLSSGPGHVVADVFWAYLVNPAHMPGGWLHDMGLPLTAATTVTAFKADGPRTVLLQAFERGILTYDPLNPAKWQVERANVGSDAAMAVGLVPLHSKAVPMRGLHTIEIDLSKQWLYAYDGDIQAFDAPVSTGRDGFETPPGSFAIYQKLRLHTMRGTEKGQTWDVPNVPNVMYFYRDFALHGTYWHNRFGTGERRSHGCVNLSLDAAAWLYDWAPLGTPVLVLR